MILVEVLSREEAERARHVLMSAPFRDGRLTAGPAARLVKENEQAAGDHAGVAALAQSLRTALQDSPTFQTLVRPLRWSRLLFSRYVAGQRYGQHTDDAAMADEHGWPLRTDMSFTVFLSEPDTYDGGELKLIDLGSERTFKPAAGTAVLYATGLIHEVLPVTNGTRLAGVGWVQSLVRRADQRELLFDLACARRELPEGKGLLHLDNAVGNLLRMWGER